MKLTNEELNFLLKIQEECILDETDQILKNELIENIKNLKNNHFTEEVRQWFEDYFDNQDPEDLTTNTSDIEIVKNILIKFGRGIKNLIKCLGCSKSVYIGKNPNIYGFKIIKVSNGKSIIKGVCRNCDGNLFKLTSERYPKSFYN
jgi:hypothetical protein